MHVYIYTCIHAADLLIQSNYVYVPKYFLAAMDKGWLYDYYAYGFHTNKLQLVITVTVIIL